MAQLAERIAHLTRRYGSDPAAWQGELHALASLEESDPKAALERFHALKRRLAEFRRAELLRALRGFAFVADVPSSDAKGYPLKEIEADIRDAARALAHARAIADAREARDALVASLVRRAPPPAAPIEATRWDALATLTARVEEERRAVAREARLDRRIVEAQRRARKLRHARVALPAFDAQTPDAALDEAEATLGDAEALEEAYERVAEPLRAPDVATWLHQSRRALDADAKARLDAGDRDGLLALVPRAEALRQEAARKASEAARARRRGASAPARERRPGDAIDGYG